MAGGHSGQRTNNGNHWIRTRRRGRRTGRGPARGQWGRASPMIWGGTGGIIPPGG